MENFLNYYFCLKVERLKHELKNARKIQDAEKEALVNLFFKFLKYKLTFLFMMESFFLAKRVYCQNRRHANTFRQKAERE